MSKTELPPPRMRPPEQGELDVAALRKDLMERVQGEVRFDPGTRGAYSTDASNFRQVPIGVVVPRSVDAAIEAVAVGRGHAAPLLSRGGGPSPSREGTNNPGVGGPAKDCQPRPPGGPPAKDAV